MVESKDHKTLYKSKCNKVLAGYAVLDILKKQIK
jgi:hypothetical protein